MARSYLRRSGWLRSDLRAPHKSFADPVREPQKEKQWKIFECEWDRWDFVMIVTKKTRQEMVWRLRQQIVHNKKDEMVESEIDSNSHIIENRASGCAEKFNQSAADRLIENATFTAPRIECVGTGREIVRARLLKTAILKIRERANSAKTRISRNLVQRWKSADNEAMKKRESASYNCSALENVDRAQSELPVR